MTQLDMYHILHSAVSLSLKPGTKPHPSEVHVSKTSTKPPRFTSRTKVNVHTVGYIAM